MHSNLALKYLYAAAGGSREKIKIIEFTINNNDDYIFTELYRGDYNVVCFSCYIWNTERILYLAENLKKAKPEVTIILGGPEVSFDSLTVMEENPFVDFILAGEGELSFRQLIDSLLSANSTFEKIGGLAYRVQDQILVNPMSPPLAFENVPFPYDYLIGEEDKVMYYESARGCPYRCSYCLSSIDKTIRALPLERVYQDLTYFIFKKVKQVKFVDRTFNWDPNRCLQIIRFLIVSDNGITNFHFELCGDKIDSALIELVQSARDGLFQFEIGVQSTNKMTLEACNRSSDFPKLVENVRKILNLGNIHVHLDLIAGLPFEDYSSFRHSFNSVYALRAQQLQLGFLKLLKGSPLREQADLFGYVFQRRAPYEVIANIFMNSMEMTKLKMIENVLDLYYNRGGFGQSIEFSIAVRNDTAFDFYEELATYYYDSGFQHKSHKKEDLYRILLQYICWREPTHVGTQERMKELLQEDMKKTLNPDAIKKFERKGWDIL